MIRRCNSRKIVRRVLRRGDLDIGGLESGIERRSWLEERRASIVEQTRARWAGPIARAQQRLEKVSGRSEELRPARDEDQSQHVVKAEQMSMWVRAGVRNKLAVWPSWLVVRAGVLLPLAGLDYYFFASAWAVHQRISEDLSNWQFDVGGILGLAVFVLGLLLARAFRSVSLARAQRSVRAENTDDHLGGLILAEVSATQVAAGVVLFALLVAAAFVIRWQAGQGTQFASTVLLALVPLIGLYVEFMFIDPTAVPPYRRKFRWCWLDWRLGRAQSALSQREKRRDEAVKRVEACYDGAARELEVILVDRGFI